VLKEFDQTIFGVQVLLRLWTLQAMLYATDGIEQKADFDKAMVGVASVWCVYLRALSLRLYLISAPCIQVRRKSVSPPQIHSKARSLAQDYPPAFLPIIVVPPFFRCNKHLLALGQRIKKSLVESDITAYQFGTVGVSDGISMGTRGMSYSLQSRDLIADSVETAAGGHWLDGMVVVPGCDKNMPGVLMARKSSPRMLCWARRSH
jgi:hypothetical protein